MSRRAGTSSSIDVAVADEGEGAAHERLGRHVEHAGPVARAAHARVGDAHHVAHALGEQLLGDGQHPPLGHAGGAQGTGVLEHEHRVGGDGQRGVVDPLLEVVVVAEDDRGPRVPQEARLHRRVLDHGAARGQVAAQDRDPALGPSRRRPRRDHVVVEDEGAVDVLAEGAAVDGDASGCSRSRSRDRRPRRPPA